MNVCTDLLRLFAGVFEGLLVLAIVGSGLVMMFAPESAKQLLKNCAIAILLFLFGIALLRSLCAASSALRLFDLVLVRLLFSVVVSLAALLLVAASLGYLFSPEGVLKWLKKLFVPVAGALLYLELVSLIASSHPLLAFIALLLPSLGAYWLIEHRMQRAKRPQKLGRTERKPIFPRGE
ncbi:MAG: hypothetical protein LAP13_22080 [Acidobacteriia bacterium]|nr:hypothetical protein [Terriglobia bacterium]